MSDWRFSLHSLHIISCWVFLAICAVAAVCACSPTPLISAEAVGQVETPVQFTTAPCRFPLPDQQPIECGDLSVPEDYSNPDGRQIRLHVAVIRSSSETPSPDPLFILYGGPGAYALDRIDSTVQRFSAVLAERDLILFDQRGVGYSQPSLNCPELDDFDLIVIDEQLNHDQLLARRLDTYAACRDRLQAAGTSLPAYSASALAADVAGLRRALGVDHWHLYGVSYGARLALMIMRDYPDGLRTLVLDSAYPVDIDLAAETAVMHTHALNTLFAAAEAKHPQFAEDFFTQVDQLDAAPIPVPVPDPRGHDWFFIKPFTGADLLQLTINLVRWPQSLPHIPGMVDDIAAGQYRDLSHFLQPSVGDQLFSEGLNLSVNCQEIDPAAPFLKKQGISSIDPRVYDLALDEVQQKMALCKLWLGEDWHIMQQSPVVSDIPTLLLRGEYEAVIPPEWSDQAAAGLSNSTALTFPGSGHGVMTSSTCAQEIVAALLHNPAEIPAANCQE